MKTPLTVRRSTILRSIVTTKKKAPKFVKSIAKNMALSSIVEVFCHHKIPDGSVVIDVTLVESIDRVIKIFVHF